MTKFKKAVIKALDNYDPFYELTMERQGINQDIQQLIVELPEGIRTQKELNEYIEKELS